MQRYFAALLAVILLGFPASCGSAQSATTVHTGYYSITGTTVDELIAQMKSRGPHDGWAYTHWSVHWSGNCRVTLRIDYTSPRWTNESDAPASLQQSWDTMVGRLHVHENGHAQHGRKAASEIGRSGCRNPMSIIRKWAEQDKIYDAQTNHGRKQGVSLP